MIKSVVFSNEFSLTSAVTLYIEQNFNPEGFTIIFELNKFELEANIIGVGQLLFNEVEKFISQIRNGLTLDELFYELEDGLVRQGRIAFNTLFFHNGLGEFIKKRFKNITYPVIEIQGYDLKIPWGLLVDEKLNSSINESNLNKLFWATTKLLAIGTSKKPSINGICNFHGCKPKIGIIYDENLHFINDEIENIKSMDCDCEVFCSSNLPNKKFIEEINIFLNKNFDILHIACHAENSQRDLVPYFIINGQKYLLDNLLLDPVVNLDSTKVIFLNTCSSGFRSHFETYGIITSMRKVSRSNFICLDCSVHSKIAKNFAGFFYNNFLKKNLTLGESVLFSKLKAIEKIDDIHNVISLFYSIYGSNSITFKIKNT